MDMNVTSARIMNFFLLILGLLVATYYNASIMNGLLSPTPELIKDIKDVLNSKKIGISNVSYLNPIYFHPLLTAKLKEYKEFPMYEIPEGVRKVRKGDFALVGDAAGMYSVMEEMFTNAEKCSTRSVKMASRIQLSCAAQKNSQYKEMFKLGYAWLQENGIAYREKRFWYPDPPHCLGGTVFRPVSSNAMTIAFCIYVSGLAVSIAVLLIELCSRKKKEPRKLFKPRAPRRFLV